jgi:hypothetical protein
MLHATETSVADGEYVIWRRLGSRSDRDITPPPGGHP